MDSQLNPEEKMFCPCNRCKHQIARRRRICDEHTKKWGVFSLELLERVLGSSSTNPAIDDISIQPERPRHAGIRPLQPTISEMHETGIEEEIFYEQTMDDMLDAMDDTDARDDDENIPRGVEQISDEQKEMRKLSRLPLYNGAKISVLRASLSILNLQSLFGWSDTSVSKLLG